MTAVPEPIALYSLMDRGLWHPIKNARTVLAEPRRHERPLFEQDIPRDENNVWSYRFDNLYPNVVLDPEDGYLCWLSPFETWKRGGSRSMTVLHAKSVDGVNWDRTQPEVMFSNNGRAVFGSKGPHGAGVMRDDARADGNARYRMLAKQDLGKKGNSIYRSFSTDGRRWSKPELCERIEPRGNTHHAPFWDARREKYVAFVRQGYTNALGQFIRIVAQTESYDFADWGKAEALRWQPPEPDESHQVYAMNAVTYAHGYLGLATMYCAALDELWCELVFSKDASTWQRTWPGHPFIPFGDTEHEKHCVFAAASPIFLDDEIRLYYSASNQPHRSPDRRGSFCLAMVPLDRFAGVGPKDKSRPGVAETKLIDCGGTDLVVSADGNNGEVVIGVLDGSNNEVLTSRRITGTVTRETIAWERNGSLASMKGEGIRLRFSLHNATVYAFGFVG